MTSAESGFVIGFLGAAFLLLDAMTARPARPRRTAPPLFTPAEFLALPHHATIQ